MNPKPARVRDHEHGLVPLRDEVTEEVDPVAAASDRELLRMVVRRLDRVVEQGDEHAEAMRSMQASQRTFVVAGVIAFLGGLGGAALLAAAALDAPASTTVGLVVIAGVTLAAVAKLGGATLSFTLPWGGKVTTASNPGSQP